MLSVRRALSCIAPPHILQKLFDSDDIEIRQAAMNTLLTTARLRRERSARASLSAAYAPENGRRTIFGCQRGTFYRLPC
jgi:hypothetical protein